MNARGRWSNTPYRNTCAGYPVYLRSRSRSGSVCVREQHRASYTCLSNPLTMRSNIVYRIMQLLPYTVAVSWRNTRPLSDALPTLPAGPTHSARPFHPVLYLSRVIELAVTAKSKPANFFYRRSATLNALGSVNDPCHVYAKREQAPGQRIPWPT